MHKERERATGKKYETIKHIFTVFLFVFFFYLCVFPLHYFSLAHMHWPYCHLNNISPFASFFPPRYCSLIPTSVHYKVNAGKTHQKPISIAHSLTVWKNVFSINISFGKVEKFYNFFEKTQKSAEKSLNFSVFSTKKAFRFQRIHTTSYVRLVSAFACNNHACRKLCGNFSSGFALLFSLSCTCRGIFRCAACFFDLPHFTFYLVSLCKL